MELSPRAGRRRRARARWPSPGFGTSSCAATPGRRGGGSCPHSSIGRPLPDMPPFACSRRRWRSPSRTSTTCRSWKPASPARCPIDTRVVVASRVLSSLYSAVSAASSSEAVASSRNRKSGFCSSARAMASRCCSPSDSTRFQCASSSRRPTRSGSPTAVNASAICARVERSGRVREAHRLRQRRHREIRPLRHHHHARARRHADDAAAERPDARDGAEQRRLAGAGRPRHQHAVAAGLDRERLGRDQRLAVRQADQEIVDRDRLSVSSRGRTSIAAGAIGGRLRLRDGGVEAVEPRDDRPPFRQLAVDVDEDRKRFPHAGEGARGLHQRAELDLPGEIGRADQDVREHRRDLRVARRQQRQALRAAT